MEWLRELDYRALLDFLRMIYEVRDCSVLVATLLTALPLLVPADMVAFCDMRPEQNLCTIRTNPTDIMTASVEEGWREHINAHPVLMHNVKTRDGRAVVFADFMTHREHRRLALYNEFFRPLRLEDGLCTALSIPLPRVVGIGLHREKWSFGKRDKLLMNLARPHIVQAWQNVRKVPRLKQRMSTLGRSLDALDCGVVTLTAGGRVKMTTRRAGKLLAELFVETTDHHLPDVLARWFRVSRKQFAPGQAPRPLARAEIERGDSRLVAHLLPGGPESLLLLQRQRGPCEPEQLEALGLTRCEAEVLSWAARGKTNVGIATILGVSPRTVQKHLENTYAKLGVETRTAAAAIALRTLPG